MIFINEMAATKREWPQVKQIDSLKRTASS